MTGARTRAIIWAAATALVVAQATATQAAPMFHPSTKVVLFTPATSDPLVARLEAELAAVGIQVRKVSMPPDGQLDAAVSREIAAGASAAIRVIPRSRGADVWTGETTARMLRRRTSGSDTSDLSVIALRTVEFLRATLLDVKKRPPGAAGAGTPAGATTAGRPVEQPPREAGGGPGAGAAAGAGSDRPGTSERATSTPAAGEAPAQRGPESPAPSRPSEATPARTAEPTPRAPAEPSAVAKPAEPEPADKTAQAKAKPERLPEWGLAPPPELAAPSAPLRLKIAAGPAMIASPGGVSPMTSVAVIGGGHFSEQAGIELMSVFPLSPSQLAKPEGTVAVKTALLGAGVVFHLAAPRNMRADMAIGASAVMVRATGTGTGDIGSAPNVGASRTRWTMAGHLRLGGGLDLNRWLGLRADVIGGLTARTAIGYDVTDVGGKTAMADWASWGPAFAVGTVGLQASW